MKKSLILLSSLTLVVSSPLFAKEPVTVTEEMVKAAVQQWCDALLKISAAGASGGNATEVATEVLSTTYNFNTGKVLFKPTLAHGANTYRLTKESALTYFVGGNPEFPEDTGFALKNWKSATFQPAGVIVDDDIGIFMGDVTLTNADGQATTVNKAFVFKFTERKPKIIVHMSALPFQPSEQPSAEKPDSESD